MSKNKSSLEKIKFYCEEINKLLANHNFDEDYFLKSVELQYACSMCVIQIGEMVALLDEEFIKNNPQVLWRQIKGARNVYVHNYGELDLNMVWNTLINDIPELKQQIIKLLEIYNLGISSAN